MVTGIVVLSVALVAMLIVCLVTSLRLKNTEDWLACARADANEAVRARQEIHGLYERVRAAATTLQRMHTEEKMIRERTQRTVSDLENVVASLFEDYLLSRGYYIDKFGPESEEVVTLEAIFNLSIGLLGFHGYETRPLVALELLRTAEPQDLVAETFIAPSSLTGKAEGEGRFPAPSRYATADAFRKADGLPPLAEAIAAREEEFAFGRPSGVEVPERLGVVVSQ